MQASAPKWRGALARASGIAAGLGALAVAVLHQGFSGAREQSALALMSNEVAARQLAQIEAVWLIASVTLAFLGAGLVLAALRRPGWLYSLGRPAALWFAAFAGAYGYFMHRAGLAIVTPELLVLSLLAALAGASAWAAAPRQPR